MNRLYRLIMLFLLFAAGLLWLGKGSEAAALIVAAEATNVEEGTAVPAKTPSYYQNPNPPPAGNLTYYYIRYADADDSKAVQETAQQQLMQQIAASGGYVRYIFPRIQTLSVGLPAEQTERFLNTRMNSNVRFIEPVPAYGLNFGKPKVAAQSFTPQAETIPWHVPLVQANAVWDPDGDGTANPGLPDGSGLVFCMIDTGLDNTHPDLAGVTINGFSQIGGENWWEDGVGLGTHSAGLANAVNNTMGIVGVLPGGADLYMVKIFTNAGAYGGDILAAAYQCETGGANVISMSIGGGYVASHDAAFQDLYDNFNILNIAAAGDSSAPNMIYPAGYDSVIASGGVDSSEAYFMSNYPPTVYNPLAQPANAHWDAVELVAGSLNVIGTLSGGGYGPQSGSGKANPAIAAGVALAWQACGGPSTTTNVDIRLLLRDSAKDLITGPTGAAGYDTSSGFGLVQLLDAWNLGSSRFGSSCPLALDLTPISQDICAITTNSAGITAALNDDFTGTTNMSFSGQPPAATANWSINPVVSPITTTVLTLDNLMAAPFGSYSIAITATDAASATNRVTGISQLNIYTAVPAAPTLLNPLNGATGESLLPTFSWTAAAQASSYQIDVAIDPSFSGIVYTASGIDDTTHTPTTPLLKGVTYYWRIIPENVCGANNSATFSFTTDANACGIYTNPGLTLRIPPTGKSGTTNSTLNISGFPSVISDIDLLTLQGSHDRIVQLEVRLQSPLGTNIQLVNNVCGNVAGFDLDLDDEAALVVGAACPHTDGNPYIPAGGSLSSFDGEDPNGVWGLSIIDSVADGGPPDRGTGELNRWDLRICGFMPDNVPPVANDDGYSGPQDNPIVQPAPGVMSNDIDAEGDPIVVANYTAPPLGALILNPDGSFNYSPQPGFIGNISFTYQLSDTFNYGNWATVMMTFTASGGNTPPVAVDDPGYMMDEDDVLINATTVLTNDLDADGDPLTAILDSTTMTGALTLNSNGSFDYFPPIGWSGTVTFTYHANDGTANSNIATVTITVNPVNNAPWASDNVYTTTEDMALTSGNLILDDTAGLGVDNDGSDGGALSVYSYTMPLNGMVMVNMDGSFVYTPTMDWSGIDWFTYQISDTLDWSNWATVTVTVTADNDMPVAMDDWYTTTAGITLTVPAAGVLLNDMDVDSGVLTSTVLIDVLTGTLNLNSDGSFDYFAPANYSGVVTFTYSCSDSSLNDWATVAITVEACVAPVMPVTAITITHNPTDIILDWLATADAASYEVWYSNNPYFMPAGDCTAPAASLNCAPVGGTNWLHAAAYGNPAANYFYKVYGANACGIGPGDPLRHTGGFTFTIVPGS